MKIKNLFAVFFVIQFFLGLANAEQERYVFDMSHSRIFFEVNHLGFSEFNGMFREFDGSLLIDEKNLENSKVNVTINMASVDSFNDGLNSHLKNEDFFDVEKHPKATFVGKKVKKDGDNQIKVIGDLTLKGVTKPLTLDVKLNKVGPHPFNKKKHVAGFSATAVIDRSEFGVKYAIPAVGQYVKLEIDVEAKREEKNEG